MQRCIDTNLLNRRFHATIAVVMDLLTDLLILQDLLDAASKRGVAVYLLLDDSGIPHFLDMCNRLQISAQQLRNMRVRMVRGCGLALSFGKLPGSLCSKYMLVDGEKVMFGSYSFTWTSSRMNRNTITVMSGQVVDFYDNDFRELYAVSDKVDLYHEFHIPKPPKHTIPTPLLKAPPTAAQPALPASTSRFQVSLGESKQVNLKVPAHKYHNPKYALVVGNSLGLTGSLQDLTRLREIARNSSESNMEKLLHTSGGTKEPSDKASQEEMSESKEDESLKTVNHVKEVQPENSQIPNGKHTPPSPLRENPESAVIDELDDSFVIIEKPNVMKFKSKKPSRLPQRSVSMQVISTGAEEGSKGQKRSQKKSCIQS
ncbi:hypothetical protein PDJAM_G00050340 [Pangasius djambal]|uniref:Uncharacterized protein n=1 Tax=Pangasius djambal TaxID=1691987 RepID=A0ACC5YXR0_9TELE|nr:hypothetical protein [Pangasius djambal]